MYLFWNRMSEYVNKLASPNWTDVVSMIFVIITALATVVAVYVTITIANQQKTILEKQNNISEKQANIALQQNRIALFEKKYIILEHLKKLLEMNKYFQIQTLPPDEQFDICDIIYANIIYNILDFPIHSIPNNMEKLNALKELESKIKISKYLYSNSNSNSILEFNTFILAVIEKIIIYKNLPSQKEIEKINEFEKNSLPSIEEELYLL